MKKQFKRGMLIAVAAATFLVRGVPAGSRDPAIDKPAPDFKATSFDGKKLTLADYKGQVLIVNFWATWCAPCKQELPLLDTYFRLREKFGLRVLAVTTEDSAPLYQLIPLSKKVSFTMARHFRGDYGPMKAVPTNFIIDRAGVLRYAKTGALTLDDLNKLLIPLLREPEPPNGD
jgi:cytochrome c biogenesis protein CcmG, thiol:disulfide interchange protein DsbE